MTDTGFGDTTGLYFAPGTTLPPGGRVTRYYTNALSIDTIKTATVSANSSDDGTALFAASTAMASVSVAGISSALSLYSACDLDGNANDNHLQLQPGASCLVRLSVQVCNTGQSDLTGITLNDNWLNCSWPTFDLPQGACTNVSSTVTTSCPGVPVGLQVNVIGKVKADCSRGACTADGASVTVNSTCSGAVGGCPASICGSVLRDYDANGNLTGEQGLAGRTVTLKNTGGSTLGTTATDASGTYCFNNLAPGTYSVVVTPPANYQQTVDPDGTKDNKTLVTVTAGQNKTGVNFGYTPSAPAVVLVKTGPVGVTKCGDKITYRFAVTNTGNACFFSGISVVDPMFGGEIWRKTAVAPGEGYVFTTNYVVKVTDQNWLTNTATAIGHAPTGIDVTSRSTWIVRVSNGLLSPWQSRDIGSIGLAGGVVYSNGIYAVVGSGSDIGGNADAFRYVYQQGNGDCSIVAKVLTEQNTDTQAKAGVMIRETLNADSKYVAAFVTPGAGVAFQSRTSTGGITSKRSTPGLVAPYWVKVVRTGSIFTAYYSATGQNNKWTSMGSVTVTMGSTVYIGLGVTSHNNTKLCTATLNNVTATP
jgi:uncharacterized repeat protein (TIGR01451 family)